MPRTRIYATLCAAWLAACSPSQQSAPDGPLTDADAEAQMEQRIGASGGVIDLQGASLEVPRGALDDDLEITIERYARTEVPEGYEGASDLFRFEPAGLTFEKPATVRLPITRDMPGARLYWSNPQGGFDVVENATIEDGVMVGQVEHFSYGFVGRAVDSSAEGICQGASTCQELLHPRARKVDLLFVIDNSGSMAEEQASLAVQLPYLMTALTTGDLDRDGTPDIAPVEDLHVGATSTDMGLIGISGIDKCNGLGDDGVLLRGSADAACGAGPTPAFLAYESGTSSPDEAAAELACMATLGTEGCGFEQQLEAALKALTPTQSEVTFLSDAQGNGRTGHGDGANEGFLRNDPSDPSLVAVILVTDEEDCSSFTTEHFAPPMALDPNDPLRSQDLNLRCFHNKDNLYPVGRYVEGLKALRPGNENLVFFGAIVGVPADLVDSDATAGYDFAVPAERDAYYDELLADPRMQETVDEDLPEGSRSLVPSCNSDNGSAYPPRRITEVARGFGANGIVQSICQEDFAPAVEPILQRMAAQLGGACTEAELSRDGDGRVACELRVQMPSGGSCDEAAYLTAMPGEDGLCILEQLAVHDDQPAAGDGWYYDDFSVQAKLCPGASDQAIVLSPDVDVPPGMRTFLHCP